MPGDAYHSHLAADHSDCSGRPVIAAQVVRCSFLDCHSFLHRSLSGRKDFPLVRKDFPLVHKDCRCRSPDRPGYPDCTV